MTRATPLKSPFLGHAVVPRTLSVEHAARGRSGLIYPSGKGDNHGRNGWRTATATASVVNTRRVPLIVCIWSPSSRHTRPHTMQTGRLAGCLNGDRVGLPDCADVAGWRCAGVADARARGSPSRSRPAPGSRTRRGRTPRRSRGTAPCATPRLWPSPHARVAPTTCAVSTGNDVEEGVWGAMERKVRLATAVSGVSERPELAPSDRFRYGERVASQQVDVLVAER